MSVVLSGNGVISGNSQLLTGALSAPIAATVTSPIDLSEHQSTVPILTWINGGGATGFNVYLDKASVHNPPTTKVVDNLNVLSYASVELDVNTQYVMRVDAVNNIGVTTGDVVTFTTLNPTVVTSIIRFEVGSNTDLITSVLLDSGTTTDDSGVWTITPDPAVDLTISTEQAFTAIGLKLSDGSGYITASATRSLRCANTDDLQRITSTLGQYPKVSMGFALFLGSGFGISSYHMDFCVMESGTPISSVETDDFSTTNWEDDVRRLKAHTQAGKATGIYVPANERWYWATMLWDPANLLTTVKIYDTTTRPWTLLDTSTLALESFNLNKLRFGHVDATGGFINSPHYFGIIAWDTTGAVFPLLPDEAYGA